MKFVPETGLSGPTPSTPPTPPAAPTQTGRSGVKLGIVRLGKAGGKVRKKAKESYKLSFLVTPLEGPVACHRDTHLSNVL